MSSSYRSSRLGLSHWDPYAMHRGGCLELYYCNMVEWCWWESSLFWKTKWFPSVLLVVWPVKIVPDMTYNVLSGTWSLYTSTTTTLLTLSLTLHISLTVTNIVVFNTHDTMLYFCNCTVYTYMWYTWQFNSWHVWFTRGSRPQILAKGSCTRGRLLPYPPRI